LADFDILEHLRPSELAAEFSRLAAQAAREVSGPEQTEEEIVAAVRRTREELYRGRYGAA
jgi:hypothetical protein